MKRGIEQYKGCDPAAMAGMSKAAITFAFEDMRHDILELYEKIKTLQPPQGAEEWIAENEFNGFGLLLVDADSLRAFLAGKVVVEAGAVQDVLELAGFALFMTPLDSKARKSFAVVAEACGPRRSGGAGS